MTINIDATKDFVTIEPYRVLTLTEVVKGGEVTLSAGGKTLTPTDTDDIEAVRAEINDGYVALGFDSDGEEG